MSEFQRQRVLIVDDEPINIKLLASELRGNYDVVFQGRRRTGNSGLRRIGGYHPAGYYDAGPKRL